MVNLRGKNILITGSSGFVGSNLAKALSRRSDIKVTLLDTKAPRYPVPVGWHFIKGSFVQPDLRRKALAGQDLIFHLGAVVGVETALKQKELLRKVNLDATIEFIDDAVQAGCKKIVFTSSSEIYGNSKKIPFLESQRAKPISDYGKYKILIEKHLRSLVKKGKIKATVVRFFNVYGPGQRDAFVISQFIKRAATGKPLIIFGSGNQTRSFTYIDDAITGLLKAMRYDQTNFEIFNIGSDQEFSLSKLANLIASSEYPKLKILYQDPTIKRYDIAKRVPSLEKSKKLLKFRAKVSLPAGLRFMKDAETV